MNRVSIDQDDECVTAIPACIEDDDGSPAGCTLEIREERREKEARETRQLASVGHDTLHFEVETGQPFLLICTGGIEGTE